MLSKKNLLFVSYSIRRCCCLCFTIKGISALSAFGTAAKARHLFHTQMFCSTGWVFTLHLLPVYLRGRTLLGVIPSSTANDFHLQNATVESILSCGTSARIPNVLESRRFMTSQSNPSSSSISTGLMHGRTSWSTFPRANPRKLCSTAPHLNSKGLRAPLNSEKLIMFISASCWGPSN